MLASASSKAGTPGGAASATVSAENVQALLQGPASPLAALSPEHRLLNLEHMVVRSTVAAATARQDFLERDFSYQTLVREFADFKLLNAQLREKVEVSSSSPSS